MIVVLHIRHLRLHHVRLRRPRIEQELIDLVRAKNIAPIPVTTLPLAKANEALVDLQKGKTVGRAVLVP